MSLLYLKCLENMQALIWLKLSCRPEDGERSNGKKGKQTNKPGWQRGRQSLLLIAGEAFKAVMNYFRLKRKNL